MTFGEYLTAATHMHVNNITALRIGQAYWNVMAQVRPDLAKMVQAEAGERYLADLDPFYDDKNLPNFLDFLAENW